MNLTSLPQFARNANRVGEIVAILSKYGLADWIDRLHLGFARGLLKGGDGIRLAELTRETRIRLILSELGTTFVKFGQVLSTRPDLIGPLLARELTKLQDQAPADAPETIKNTIQAELGQPVEELFTEFNLTPLASASIAQVHRARLANGTAVAVKVQHAGIEAKVRPDLDILVGLAGLAEKYLPELEEYRPRATAVEFQRILLRELDFGREERNLQQFEANFVNDPTARFPRVYAELSTSRVLTMEFLEGAKLSDPSGIEALGLDRELLARRGAQIFLEMIFRDGFYHADPHPGNFVLLPGGEIGLLDCGMVGHLSPDLREDIEEMITAIVSRDAAHLTAILLRLTDAPPEVNRDVLTGDVNEFLSYHASRRLDQVDLGAALTELTELIHRHHLVLPTGIALLLKVLVMLEGTSRLLNPRFNLTEILQSYQSRILWRHFSPARRAQGLFRLYREWKHLGELLPRGVISLLQQFQRGKFDLHVEHRRLEPAVNRVVLGLLASSLFLGSTLLWSHEVAPVVAGVSVPGALGCTVAVAIGLRLLRAITKSGKLD